MPMPTENATTQTPMLETAIPAIERLDAHIARANDARIADIHGASSGLANLETALASGRAARIDNLKNFKSDESLARLEKLAAEQRDEFDALDFIGRLRLGSGQSLWGWELFQSRIIAWLLDPKQSHGHGDRFLKEFLERAGALPDDQSPDWSETKVILEWANVVDGQPGFLDILIVNDAWRTLCAIENKTFSGERRWQLTQYRAALENEYPAFTRYYVFLTPNGVRAAREEERKHWTPLAYSAIFDIIQRMLADNEEPTNEDVRAFLRQYSTTLRRNIMPDTSVAQLARKIYLEHREAIDEIVDHKPDWVAEAKPWFKEAVAKRPEWKLDVEDKNFVRFRSAEWDEYEVFQKGTGWAPESKALLLFRFRLYGGVFWLDIGLSQTKKKGKPIRKKLFEAARQRPDLFNLNGAKLTDDWIVLHEERDYILDESDYGVGWDDGSTRAKVQKWIDRFAEEQFPAMNEVIVECLREYEAEGQG